MYCTQPPPPPPCCVVADNFQHPPPPLPEYYVGPAWFDVMGPPPMPCCVAASGFSFSPPPAFKRGTPTRSKCATASRSVNLPEKDKIPNDNNIVWNIMPPTIPCFVVVITIVHLTGPRFPQRQHREICQLIRRRLRRKGPRHGR
ncbi:hypothetical protein QTP88_028672 [Uroleucon formosanum]